MWPTVHSVDLDLDTAVYQNSGLEAATLNGLPTKLDQLSSDGIGKDSGYGGSRPLRGTEV